MGLMSGIIGKLLSFARVQREGAKLSDVKIDIGGGDVLTAEYTHPSGDDSFPLPDDYVSLVRIPRSGRVLVLGFVETDAEQKAEAGDKRIYARDASRVEMAEVWLKSDGTVVVANDNGSFTLRPDGSQIGENSNGNFELRADGSHRTENASGYIELLANGTVDINGATINPAGDIETPTKVTAPSMIVDGKELKDHDHNITSGSSSPGPTGPNN